MDCAQLQTRNVDDAVNLHPVKYASYFVSGRMSEFHFPCNAKNIVVRTMPRLTADLLFASSFSQKYLSSRKMYECNVLRL